MVGRVSRRYRSKKTASLRKRSLRKGRMSRRLRKGRMSRRLRKYRGGQRRTAEVKIEQAQAQSAHGRDQHPSHDRRDNFMMDPDHAQHTTSTKEIRQGESAEDAVSRRMAVLRGADMISHGITPTVTTANSKKQKVSRANRHMAIVTGTDAR